MINLPNFIDLHTHTRFPDKNNFPTSEINQAAKYGGYSEILAMANSEIPIDSIENLETARSLDQNLDIKVHRVGALTKNLDGTELVNFKEFINQGVKIFSDDGKTLVDNKLAEKAFEEIAQLGGAIFQHCEKNCHTNPGDIAPRENISDLIPIFDDEEFEIIERDLKFVEKYKTRYHVQHLSSKKSVELIKLAKEKNLPVTAEVTPHHLLKNQSDIDLATGNLKMYPPLRTNEDQLALINGLKSGVIDVIATDHAPHVKETKEVSFKKSARGVVGLESAFAVLLSSELFTIDELTLYMSLTPNKILKELGYDSALSKSNNWIQKSNVYKTKSFHKNSAFENFEVSVMKEELHV